MIQKRARSHTALDASGFFSLAWIIPYGIGVISLTILMLPIIRKLDHKIRFWFSCSAVTFVTGALGLEMLEGKYLAETNTQRDAVYFWLMTCEESMEMVGLVVLVYASLLLLQEECGGFWVHFPAVCTAPLSSNKLNAGGAYPPNKFDRRRRSGLTTVARGIPSASTVMAALRRLVK